VTEGGLERDQEKHGPVKTGLEAGFPSDREGQQKRLERATGSNMLTYKLIPL
jgi:hypothetical protein